MNSTVEILLATETEIETAVELIYASFLYHEKIDKLLLINDATRMNIKQENLKRFANPNFKIFLAKTENRFVGIITLYVQSIPHINPNKKFLRIEDLFVVAECRNRGVAKQLMDKCYLFAREAGIENLSLNVLSNNEAAVAFYKKMGFETSALKMAKHLSS